MTNMETNETFFRLPFSRVLTSVNVTSSTLDTRTQYLAIVISLSAAMTSQTKKNAHKHTLYIKEKDWLNKIERTDT